MSRAVGGNRSTDHVAAPPARRVLGATGARVAGSVLHDTRRMSMTSGLRAVSGAFRVRRHLHRIRGRPGQPHLSRAHRPSALPRCRQRRRRAGTPIRHALTAREQQVLCGLAAEGQLKPSRAISASPTNGAQTPDRVYVKLECHDRLLAVARAKDRGILRWVAARVNRYGAPGRGRR